MSRVQVAYYQITMIFYSVMTLFASVITGATICWAQNTMTIENYEVNPLFAEPFFRANINHAISDKQIAYLKKLKMNGNQSNLISDNLYIFDEPELASVKAAIQESLDIYASEVLGIGQKLYITQSWTLINHPNVGMHGHSHSNSIISGSLYYCEMPTPVSGMIFDKHRTYQQIELRPEDSKRNIFNTTVNIVTPKTGEVILFSSSLQHMVEANSSSEPRYSIAFNSFIRGKVGSFRDVSELTL